MNYEEELEREAKTIKDGMTNQQLRNLIKFEIKDREITDEKHKRYLTKRMYKANECQKELHKMGIKINIVTTLDDEFYVYDKNNNFMFRRLFYMCTDHEEIITLYKEIKHFLYTEPIVYIPPTKEEQDRITNEIEEMFKN